MKHYAIVLAMGVGLLLLSYAVGCPRICGSDEAYYAVVARNLVEHGSLNTTLFLPDEIASTGFPGRDTHMPGYMILLALPVALFGPTDEAFLLLSQLGYVACGLLVFWAGRRLFSSAVGYASAAAFYVYPLFFFYANTAMTEITLQVVGLLFFCVWLSALQKPRLAHSLALSLLLVVGTVIRPTFVLFLPAALHVLWRWPPEARRRAVIWFGLSLLVLLGSVVYPLSLDRAQGSYKFFEVAGQDDTTQVAAGFLDNFVLQAARYARLPKEFPDEHIRLLQVVILALGGVGLVRFRGHQRSTAGYFLFTGIATWLFLAFLYTPSGSRGLRNLMVIVPPGLILLNGLLFSLGSKAVKYGLVAAELALFFFFAWPGMQGAVDARKEFYTEESRKAEAFASVLGAYHPQVVLAYKPYLYAVRYFPVNVIRRFPESPDIMRAVQDRVTIDAIVVDDLLERDRFVKAARDGAIADNFRPVNQEPVDGYYFLVRGDLFKRALDIQLGDDLVLLGVDTVEAVTAGEPLPLTLVWMAGTDIRRDYAMAVRLLDGQGREAQYWLGRPVLSTHPTTEWRAHEVVVDTWEITVAPSLPTSRYRLEVEVYDTSSDLSVGKIQVGELSVATGE